MPKWLQDFLVGLAILVTYGLASTAATAYLGALKRAERTHSQLSPLSAALASLSPWAVLAILALIFGAGLFVVYKLLSRNRPTAPLRPPPRPAPPTITLHSQTPQGLAEAALRVRLAAEAPQALKWRELAPFVNDYNVVWDLVIDLDKFSNGLPILTGKESGQEVTQIADRNAVLFDAMLRERIVQCVTMLRNNYQLMHSNLTDTKLTNRVSGVLGVNPLMYGLRELAEDLGKKIIDKAVSLNAG